ncbi:MAG: putative ABC transporter permease [Roseburia sp.]|nr:putative ABC transporter permease [Roseburia sp.]
MLYHYTIVQWIFFFYVYCFLGWCFESAFVSLKSRKPVNRGFMRGPFLPLYGSGAIMMLVVSMPFQNHVVLVYLAGCVGATALEYVTGVVMEALFHVRYWDYSNQRFNFQGHICLSSTLAWGVLTILMTNYLHKPVEYLVLLIPSALLTLVTFVLTAVIFADFAVAFKTALDLRDVLVKLERAKEELAHVQKRLDVVIALTEEELSERREEFKEEFSERKEQLVLNLTVRKQEWETRRAAMLQHLEGSMRHVIRGNSTMQSIQFKESFEELRKLIEEKRSR